MTTLAVELAASRLLGNIYGNSNMVWATIIGLILIYLTVGYFLGGRWADRSPQFRTMYTLMAWGAFLIGLIPMVAQPVLRLAAEAFDQLDIGVMLGSFVSVLVLFSVPIVLLGMISPFAIRLALDAPQEAGTVSGKIYAISTIGSFIGTFLPVLIFIPALGTTRTFLTFSLFLSLVALGGIWLALGWKKAIIWAWMPVILVLLMVLGTGGTIKASVGQIFETESAYNYIQVLEQDGYRYLRLNDGQGTHSIYHPEEIIYYGPWMEFLAGPFFNPAPHSLDKIKNMAIIGLAAGTTARQATEAFGPIPIDGFEIDPKIIEVGRRFFDMNEPNLNAIAQDGRWGLEHSSQRYSLIAIDAYRPPYIPWHLTTREFFEIVKAHLTTDGVVAINVGRAPDDRRLVDAMAGTMQSVFPSVHLIDVPGTFNTIIYATKQQTRVEDLFANLIMLIESGDVHPVLIEALKIAALNLQPMPQSQLVLTDDRAPVEWITNNMILRFILYGDLEQVEQGGG